ncbi:MAG: TVP38/TMEM64 family protein [Bacilli bacterium]|nr:TVP38/TMEM64 family protein [Bacilli bacterium]
MQEWVDQAVEFLTGLLASFGIFSGFFIIFLESIIPILPLGLFVSLNVITFGSVLGTIISWLGAIVGSMTSFFISRKIGDHFTKKFKDKEKIEAFRKKIDKLSYPNLVLLIAVPFTPQFAVNIGAGLSKMDKKKFFAALIIGKLPLVYFWGFIGKSLLESITDPAVIAQILFMLLLAYLVSRIANKFMKE